MYPVGRDRHDVAGAEPPVVGEPVVGAVRPVVRRTRPTAPAPRVRPSSRRPRATSPPSPRARISTNGTGRPCVARCAYRVVRVALRHLRGRASTTLPSGDVSVMPQACVMLQAVAPVVRLDHRAGRRRAADDHRADAREVALARVRVEPLQHAHPDRGHAGRDGHALRLEQLREAVGIEVRSGQDHLRADHDARVGQAPALAWNIGTTGSTQSSWRTPRVSAMAAPEGVQHHRAVRIHARPWAGRSCPTCSTWPRRRPRGPPAGSTGSFIPVLTTCS